MRDIKFRAWDKELNRFRKPFECTQLVIRLSGRVTDGATIPNIVLNQYTGLKDKNGKEVYEGDIVRMHYFFENYGRTSCYIFEDEDEIVCKLSITPLGVYFENNNMTGYLCDYLEDPSEELEVIGNIYENPDLLGEPNEN